MPKSTNATRSSRALPIFELALALALAGAVSAAALAWFHSQGYLLYYGDAQAHLNIARRIIDSRTPGPFQFGTVWLPLPHAAMLPFAGNTEWWATGLAGGIPSAIAFTLAAVFLFAAVRRIFSSSLAAWTATVLFLTNPNALYLQSTAMTEAYFFAALFALLYFSHIARQKRSGWAAAAAGAACCAATLCRYEGWFLIPFVALYLLTAKSLRPALIFTVLASLGPLSWLAHNLYYYSDPLEFYHGRWSAKAIYERALAGGMDPYPGDGDWRQAAQYYAESVRLAVGTPLLLLGLIGVAGALFRRHLWPVALLALPAGFYIWSMHSSGTPIYVPRLWPHSYYNTRYGLAALPLVALAASALIVVLPKRLRFLMAFTMIAAAAWPWGSQPALENVICWKESQVNSTARREWTRQAAAYMRQHYKGGGIAAPFGDLTGIFAEAGIPLKEILHDGNEPYWESAIARPEFFLREEWAVAFSGDALATAILRAERKAFAARQADPNTPSIWPRYERVKMIYVKGAPVVEIYRRAGQSAP